MGVTWVLSHHLHKDICHNWQRANINGSKGVEITENFPRRYDEVSCCLHCIRIKYEALLLGLGKIR